MLFLGVTCFGLYDHLQGDCFERYAEVLKPLMSSKTRLRVIKQCPLLFVGP